MAGKRPLHHHAEFGGRAAALKAFGKRRVEAILKSKHGEFWIPGTDLFQAIVAAKFLTPKAKSHDKILKLGAQLTTALMDEPEVWLAVEHLAELLLEQSDITDGELLNNVCAKLPCLPFRSALLSKEIVPWMGYMWPPNITP